MTEDAELLRQYAQGGSETAFADLVARHLPLVYAAALRQVHGDAASAKDVAQTVFIDLARKANSLLGRELLAGWLYTSTRFAASMAIRGDQRRLRREQLAAAMAERTTEPESPQEQAELKQVLDDAMSELGDEERNAVLIRYFQGKELKEVGVALGISEDAARMRVTRALEKLQVLLKERGVTITTVALGTALATEATAAVPAGLVASISATALASAAAAGGGLGAGVLKFLASMQAKLWVAAVVTAFVAGWFVLPRLNPSRPFPVAIALPAEEPAVAPAAASNGSLASTTDAPSPSWSTTSNKLVLHIVAADTGKPIPSVTIDYILLEATNHSHQQFQATRLGVCEIPVPRSTVTRLVLWSQTEGLADTWLYWRLDRGDIIPEEYTLRLARAVQIGGQVVDWDGQPVADARVSFGTGGSSEEALSNARPEAHVVVGITAAPTDSAGHWSLCRIAPEVFPRMEAEASHPEHLSTRISVAGDPVAEQQLLAGTYVFRLGRAVTLTGVILDPDSQPVPGAKLEVHSRPDAALTTLRERMAVGQIRFATNQADGAFMLAGCAPGANEITVQAAGFIPSRVEVQSATNSPPLRIILQRGKVLRLHVVDQNGAPVPRAEVEIAGSRTPLRTDDEGRLQWDGAAAGDVALQVRASGYIWAENVTAKADGQEHLITLSPAMTISGSVRDAVTGRPVPHFRILSGWPRRVPFTPTTNFQWQSVGQASWISSAEGKFSQPVAEAGDQDTSLAFKFDAEGYAPFVTRVVRSDEGAVQFNVALRPAASVTITVLLPDGNPAVNADVGLVSPGALLRVRPGGLSRGNTYPSAESVPTTDDQGRFVLPPDEEVTAVIVANQDGYAEATRAALAAEPVIRLQPWGRIEGTFLSRDRVAAGRVVQFQYGTDAAMHNTVCADFFAYETSTDSDGRFLFAQVPPGKHRVAERGPQTALSGGARVFRSSQMSVEVEVGPGQTTSVTLGNSNYTVTARLGWPAELKIDPNWDVMLSMQKPLPVAPAEVRRDAAALAAWRAQPEIAAAYSLRRGPLRFSEEADGTFVAENVPPGSYDLAAIISEVPSGGGRPKLRASARVRVTIPANPPSGTLDLGEIILQAAH